MPYHRVLYALSVKVRQRNKCFTAMFKACLAGDAATEKSGEHYTIFFHAVAAAGAVGRKKLSGVPETNPDSKALSLSLSLSSEAGGATGVETATGTATVAPPAAGLAAAATGTVAGRVVVGAGATEVPPPAGVSRLK